MRFCIRIADLVSGGVRAIGQRGFDELDGSGVDTGRGPFDDRAAVVVEWQTLNGRLPLTFTELRWVSFAFSV